MQRWLKAYTISQKECYTWMDIKTVNNMVCIVKLYLLESAEELKEILSRQTELKLQQKVQKVQALYWWKIGVADTIEYIYVWLGCHRTTVSRWFSTYIQLGKRKLIEPEKKLLVDWEQYHPYEKINWELN